MRACAFLWTRPARVADDRSVVVEAAHNRQRKVDIAVLSKAVQSVVDMHAVSLLHRQVWDRYVAASSPSADGPESQPFPPPLFQHAHSRRVRWTRDLAAKGIRHFGTYVWTALVAPLVREITQRARDLSNETSSPQEVSNLAQSRDEAATTGDSFGRALKHAQMSFLVRQARALVPVAVEAHLIGVEDMPTMALLAVFRSVGVVDNVELYVELMECGELPRDAQSARLAQGCVILSTVL